MRFASHSITWLESSLARKEISLERLDGSCSKNIKNELNFNYKRNKLRKNLFQGTNASQNSTESFWKKITNKIKLSVSCREAPVFRIFLTFRACSISTIGRAGGGLPNPQPLGVFQLSYRTLAPTSQGSHGKNKSRKSSPKRGNCLEIHNKPKKSLKILVQIWPKNGKINAEPSGNKRKTPLLPKFENKPKRSVKTRGKAERSPSLLALGVHLFKGGYIDGR